MREAELRKRFGLHLKACRKARGLSQAELGKRIRLTAEGVSKIERGLSFTGIGTLYRISQALGIEVAELFSWVPNKALTDAEVRQRELVAKFRALISSEETATVEDIASIVQAVSTKK